MFNEKLVSLTEAVKLLPPVDGRRLHVSSLWRWAQKGVQGVRLETRRIGRRIVTSAEALERFTEKLAEVSPAGRPRKPAARKAGQRSDAQRERDVAQAEAELDRAGV